MHLEHVFISHTSEEAEAATLLKGLLLQGFAARLSVFVSSDGQSLGGGQEWLQFIRRSAKTAKIVFVLISLESAERPWLLFEAGLGDGSGSTVIPVLLGDISFTELQFPLSGFQARRLPDLRGLVADVQRLVGIEAGPVDYQALELDINDLLLHLPRSALQLQPTMTANIVSFRLVNQGSMPIELLEVKAAARVSILEPGAYFPSAQTHILNSKNESLDGREFKVIRLNTHAVTRPSTGVDHCRNFSHPE